MVATSNLLGCGPRFRLDCEHPPEARDFVDLPQTRNLRWPPMLNSDALVGRTVTDQCMTEVARDRGVVKAEYAHLTASLSVPVRGLSLIALGLAEILGYRRVCQSPGEGYDVK